MYFVYLVLIQVKDGELTKKWNITNKLIKSLSMLVLFVSLEFTCKGFSFLEFLMTFLVEGDMSTRSNQVH